MTNSSTYVTLDSIIRDLLAREELSMHYYPLFYLHAKNAVKTIHKFYRPEVKTTPVDIVDGIGDIPVDCTKIHTVWLNEDGRKSMLTEDKNLAIVPDDNIDEFTNKDSNGIPMDLSMLKASVNANTYAVDGDQIRVNETLSLTRIYVTHSYDVTKIGTSISVNALCEDVIWDYIKWKRAASNSMKRLDASLLERNYYNSLKIFRAVTSGITIGAIRDRLRKTHN